MWSVRSPVDDGPLYILLHAPEHRAILAARGLLHAALTEWELKDRHAIGTATVAVGWLVENVVRDLHGAGLPDALEVSIRLLRREACRFVHIDVFDRISERSNDQDWPPELTGLDLSTIEFGRALEKAGRRTWIDVAVTTDQ
ncbi:hypothetical protein ACFQ07_33035 [Actinomadura adrarensis]|uniref:Uncharacterized protein n=1 Tax=Actinomadura adrarensis TaxID=1819600 RepID=A0ABW3CSU1_9ACTN